MVTTTIVQTAAKHPVPCRTAAPLPFAAAVFSVQPPRRVFFHLQTRPRSTAAAVCAAVVAFLPSFSLSPLRHSSTVRKSRVRSAAQPPRHLRGQGWPLHLRDVACQLLMSWP
ncbi:BCL-6 corepressor [Sesbania bispinosa]|nr:BCL-6 corepressor [Sesbania bispinosa]